MANLRVVRLSVKSSTSIQITFTANLDAAVNLNNVKIEGVGGTTPNIDIISTSVLNKDLTITIRPMVARDYYKCTLFSTETQKFRGAKGESLVEDGANNIIFFVGQIEDNPIRDNILDLLPGSYDKETGTVLFDAIDAGAQELLDAAHDTGEVKSANYISVEMTDELKIRGNGPYDRFSNEGVYQVLRVGATQTGATLTGSLSYDAFPSDPITLQQMLVDEEVVSNSSDESNGFNGLTITLSKRPVIKVTSIVLVRGSTSYIYNIEQYRYGLLESKYDSLNSYTFLDIADNQIKLTNSAIGAFPMPQANDTIIVSYYYKRLGRNISADSLLISIPVSVVRDSTPSVSTTFFLNHAPIIDSNGNTQVLNGAVWLDPGKNFDPAYKHPAFVTEIKFSEVNLPMRIGEYSVNYETGQVFVFGADGSGVDGTTTIPPVVSYLYKKEYQSNLDYVFYSDLNEVASIPERELRGNPAIVDFMYEDDFADGTDFAFKSHIEVINERVENRLIDNIGIKTLYGPVKEVFRIYNETTGEIYTPVQIKDNEVYFNSITPPRINDVIRESVQFDQVTQAQLVIIDEILFTGKAFDKVFKINLEKTDIVSANGGFIGASFNTSLEFSDKDVFTRELYFDLEISIDANLDRLQEIGDYTTDYELGIVYVAVDELASTNIGDAAYRYGKILAKNTHVTSVNDIYRNSSVLLENVEIFTAGTIEDNLIEVLNLQHIGEYADINGDPIVVTSSETVEVRNDIFRLGKVFQITDLKTTFDPINFGEGAVKSSSISNIIYLNGNGSTVFDDNNGAGIVIQSDGRNYIEAVRISDLFAAGLVELTGAVNVCNISNGENYFSYGTDGYVDVVTNRIYLPSIVSEAGTLVEATYKAKLRAGAAVLVEYTAGNVFIDYSYSPNEIIINYEYGDNILDWSISSNLNSGEPYYVSYRYGALRNSLRDNFGVLTGIDDLSTISDDLNRETYRAAISGTMQTFPKGPTIPSIKQLVKAFTQIDPTITESVFLEWILGRDFLNLQKLHVSANNNSDLPTYDNGKFDKGIVIDKPGQILSLPANSNFPLTEGTWESFVIPEWDGIDNDADITFDIAFDGVKNTDRIFIGSNSIHPVAIPFTLSKEDIFVLGKPSYLHKENGYFIWFDSTANKWRVRARAPISEERVFSGNIFSNGEFYNVRQARTADGYAEYEASDGYINEVNDIVRSTKGRVYFSFVVDANDYLNTEYDAYDSYGASFAGFDGIDFSSDLTHYLFDTGVENTKRRMSIFKDGQGFLKLRVYDDNGLSKVISKNIQSWKHSETHHVAASWKINTIEQYDELHLFVDGVEVPNTYRFKGNFSPYPEVLFMDPASELLSFDADGYTVGGFDLRTVVGSNVVISTNADFNTAGVRVGDRFVILDSTVDGISTLTSPYVFVRSIPTMNSLELEWGDTSDFLCELSLSNVKFSINPLYLETTSNPLFEKVKVFAVDLAGYEKELYSPDTLYPDYAFMQDGYKDYVCVYNNVMEGDSVTLKSYGMTVSKCTQKAFVWSNNRLNILNTKLPSPTAISKINVTKIITSKTSIEAGAFAIIATDFGGHYINTLGSDLEFCQPSNSVTGRRVRGIIYGDNFNFAGINKITIFGDTYDGSGSEELNFTTTGELVSTKYFQTITDVTSTFTPIDLAEMVGSVEIKEAFPLNWQENGGDYAEIRLSVQQAISAKGEVTVGTNELYDSYGRFDENDIGKTINILSPPAIVGVYTIADVLKDPSDTVKDSNTVKLSGVSWGSSYTDVLWQLINTSFGDSGFANGLITLEIYGSGGIPFLLGRCWYEIDLPTHLVVPWTSGPDKIFFGSDNLGNNQSNAIIDELRILNEMSLDTSNGEILPSSGRSISTDNLAVREYSATPQTLSLFHFDDSTINDALFYNNYSKAFKQSESSVNARFGQSAIFNIKKAYKVDNKGIFNNNGGTIEFWVSPILDTYNDPTKRYYIDLSPEQTVIATVVSTTEIILPIRARSVSSIKVSGKDTNYVSGSRLKANGIEITLTNPLPKNVLATLVTFVPIASSGDRFSIYKSDNNHLTLYVSASGVEYQINAPIYWKKNSWHRVMVEWSLNNTDNQDRLALLVDGSEAGIIRYGTGLLYGSGIVYGQQNIWGSENVGTASARNILADINLLDTFNTINVGADYTEEFTALARMDNIRFSSEPRAMVYMGGTGPGRLLGKDLLYTRNVNVAQPVISDALTKLLLDFDTDQTENEYLAIIRDKTNGIFDFYVDVIDSFALVQTDLVKELIISLINQLKPAHTRAFVSFTR